MNFIFALIMLFRAQALVTDPMYINLNQILNAITPPSTEELVEKVSGEYQVVSTDTTNPCYSYGFAIDNPQGEIFRLAPADTDYYMGLNADDFNLNFQFKTTSKSEKDKGATIWLTAFDHPVFSAINKGDAVTSSDNGVVTLIKSEIKELSDGTVELVHTIRRSQWLVVSQNFIWQTIRLYPDGTMTYNRHSSSQSLGQEAEMLQLGFCTFKKIN